MGIVWVLLALAFALSIICVAYLLRGAFRTRRDGEPAIVKGSTFWGNAKDFGTHAVKFLHASRKEYGDVFTLRLVNKHLTVLMNPNDFEEFSRQRNFDFDKIQKQVNWNVFNFILKDPTKMINTSIRTHKGSYMHRGMTSYVGNLEYALNNIHNASSYDEQGWATDQVREFCAKSVFNAVFNSIFGRSDDQKFNSYMAYHHFEVFHQYFNYFWLGFPKKMFPSAMKSLLELIQQPGSHEMMSRPDSSEYIKIITKIMLDDGQSESDIIGHNLVYLHVNYNTLRLSFWILNNILYDQNARRDVKEEIDDLIESRREEDGTATFSVSDIDNLPVLDSIVKESARMASGVFMIRYIKEDTWFTSQNGKKYLMREGDQITMYPPAYHKDPEIFENPEEFQYDRFVDAKFFKDGVEIRQPVMPFGSLCPGRKLAMFHMKWFVFSTFNAYDMESVAEQPASYDYTCHGHEVLPPIDDIAFRYKQRQDRPVLKVEH